MLITAFGTSTPYAYWGFAFIGHILDELHGSYLRIHCLTLDEFRNAWKDRDGRAVLFTSDRPEPSVVMLLRGFDFPTVAFVDLPEDEITVAIRLRGMSPDQACRFASQHFSSLEPALRQSKVSVYGSDWYQQPLRKFAAKLLMEVIGDFDAALVDLVMARVAPNVANPGELTVWQALQENSPEAWAPRRGLLEQNPSDQRLIMAVAKAYSAIFEQRTLTNLEWPRELFYSANEGYVAPQDVDLLGRSRFLIWGPYAFLPLGDWRVHVQFEVVDNRSGNEIEADVHIGGKVVAAKRGSLPAHGAFAFFMDFSVTSLADPIEVRINLLKGAIEGRFGLKQVALERRLAKEETPASVRARISHKPIET